MGVYACSPRACLLLAVCICCIKAGIEGSIAGSGKGPLIPLWVSRECKDLSCSVGGATGSRDSPEHRRGHVRRSVVGRTGYFVVGAIRLRGGGEYWNEEDYDHTRVVMEARSKEEERERQILGRKTHAAVRKAAEIHRYIGASADEILEKKERLLDVCEDVDTMTGKYLFEKEQEVAMGTMSHEEKRQRVSSADPRTRRMQQIVEKYEREAQLKSRLLLSQHAGLPTSLCLNRIGARYSPSASDKTVVTLDDVLKASLGTLVDGYVVESGLCRARDPRFEDLLMAAYEATREGVRITGSDQLISDVTDAIQEIVESYEVDVLDRKHYKNLLETGSRVDVRSVESVGDDIVPLESRCVERIPCRGPEEGEQRDEVSRMHEGGVYGIHVMASTGSGQLSKRGTCTDYRLAKTGHEDKLKMPLAKDILSKLRQSYDGRAWCRRYLENMGINTLDAPLKHLADAKVVQEYPQMWDIEGAHIAQYEHTVICKQAKEVLSQCNEWGVAPTIRARDQDVNSPQDGLDLADVWHPNEWR